MLLTIQSTLIHTARVHWEKIWKSLLNWVDKAKEDLIDKVILKLHFVSYCKLLFGNLTTDLGVQVFQQFFYILPRNCMRPFSSGPAKCYQSLLAGIKMVLRGREAGSMGDRNDTSCPKSKFLKFLWYFSIAENLSFRTHSFLFCLLMLKQISYLGKINRLLTYHGWLCLGYCPFPLDICS